MDRGTERYNQKDGYEAGIACKVLSSAPSAGMGFFCSLREFHQDYSHGWASRSSESELLVCRLRIVRVTTCRVNFEVNNLVARSLTVEKFSVSPLSAFPQFCLHFSRRCV